MENILETKEKFLVFENMGYVYTVDPDTDLIQSAIRKHDQVPNKDVIGTEYKMYFNKTAKEEYEFILKIKNKKKQEKKNPKEKKVEEENNKIKSDNKIQKTDNNSKNKENKKATTPKKQIPKKKKIEIKILIPEQPVFSESCCENVLFNLLNKDNNANSKKHKSQFLIISTFKNCLENDLFEKLGLSYYELKPEDHIAFIRVKGKDGEKFTTKRNPLFPFNIQFAIDSFAKHIDVLILPPNKYILEEAIKSPFKINLLIPKKEMKEDYLKLINSKKYKFRKNLEKNYEKFIDEINDIKDKVNYIELDKDNLIINEKNYNNFDLFINNIHINKI